MGEGWGFSSDREPHGIIGRSFPRDGGRVIVVGALDAPAFYRFGGLCGTGIFGLLDKLRFRSFK